MKRNSIIVSLFLFGIILYSYWGLWNTFFQQDEWASMGLALSGGVFAGVKDVIVIELASGKMRVLGTLLNNFIHLYFPFNITVFSVFALVIHWINSVLVYVFAFQLTKRQSVAFIAALYFSVAAVSSGAVLWISANTTALLNATFVLVSLICYIKYLNTSSAKYRNYSFVAAILAFLFKESSIFLFVLLPLMSVIFHKKNNHELFYLYLGFIILVRSLSLSGVEGKQGVFVTQQSNAIVRMVTHALLYPLIAFSQMFIPQELMTKLTHQISVSDTVSVMASVFLIGLFLSVIRKRTVIFCFLYCLLSFLPFIVLDRPMSSYLESRYYYLGVIGAAILLGLLVTHTKLRKTASIFLLLSVGFFCYKNSIYIRREEKRQIIIADERKQFLQNIKTMVPMLPDDPIIFISGDSPGFYGIGDLSVPFQQGLGYTMMVWYFDTGKIPTKLLSDMYLWNINEQGYKESDGKGFGYFWDESRLLDEMKRNPKINPDQIIAFRYIASEKKLLDKTQEMRTALSGGRR